MVIFCFIMSLVCHRHLPLAKDLVRLARQQLVHRLDSYMSRKNEPVFRRVLSLVDKQVILLRFHSFTTPAWGWSAHVIYVHLMRHSRVVHLGGAGSDWLPYPRLVLRAQVVPLLRKCSLAGHAEFKTRDTVFSDNEVAPDMLLDVLSDRGFSGSHVINERIIPAKVRIVHDYCKGEILGKCKVFKLARLAVELDLLRR